MLDRLPRTLLHTEGAVLFAAALVLYIDADFSILALVLLFLAPDLSALGYLAGPRIGSASYDAVHTTVAPVALGVIGIVGESGVASRTSASIARWATD